MAKVTQKKENINTSLSEIDVIHKLAVSVDCVVFGYTESGLKLLLIQCNMPPYRGLDSLIGDLIHADESLNEAAKRVLKEKASLESVYIEQVEVFSRVDRHPLSRVITIAYYALVNVDDIDVVDAEQRGLTWKPLELVEVMAFDHMEILGKCLRRLKRSLITEPVGFKLLPEKFTINQLQKFYEVILGIKIDKRNFRRKLNDLNLLLELNETQKDVNHRPAKLYIFNPDLQKRNLNIIPNFEID